jgi:HlyD family secretion protein
VFDGDSPSGLKQNQRVQARLRLESHSDVLKLARGPFLEAGGGRQAYRVLDGMAVLTEIAVGAVSVTEVEIRSGLAEGDQVVVSDTSRFEGAGTVLVR